MGSLRKDDLSMRYLLFQAIDASAERYPEAEAVRFSGQCLTNAELSRLSSNLAGVLADQGVSRGDRVGIYMNKGLESAIAIYGIMKAGAAYVPLDPFAPLARLGYVIKDCGIRHLLSNHRSWKRSASSCGSRIAPSRMSSG
jgi:acyl-CoA synthetase (AMP-forming)/AMP-acid ligase II